MKSILDRLMGNVQPKTSGSNAPKVGSDADSNFLAKEPIRLLGEIDNKLGKDGELNKRLGLILDELKKGGLGTGPSMPGKSPKKLGGGGDEDTGGPSTGKYIPTMAENIAGKFGTAKKLLTGDVGTLRNVLHSTRIMDKNSGGIFSNALKRAENKQQYIADRMATQGTTFGSKKSFAASFEKSEGVKRDIEKNDAAISGLRKRGFKEEQIKRGGFFKKATQLQTDLGEADTRYSESFGGPKKPFGDQKNVIKKEEVAEKPKKAPKKAKDNPVTIEPIDDLAPRKPSQTAKKATKKAKERAATDVYWQQMVGGADAAPAASVASGGEVGGGEENVEVANENNKKMDEQTDILKKIEENTSSKNIHEAKKQEENKGGDDGGPGLLSGLLGGGGGSGKKAMEGMKNFGIGLLAIAGALWVASKAFKSFGEVEWADVGKGITALGALVVAAIALDKVKDSMFKSGLALGVLALATWGIAEAFKTFADLDWETIGKGFVAIAGLGAIGAILGMFAPQALLGAVALAALGAAVWVVGKGFQEMEEPFNTFTTGIEKLAAIGGQGLLGVAAGMAALGVAMAAFGAGQAAAGLGTLVSNLLTFGQDSPVDQLLKIGEAGPGIEKAASGLDKLGQSMKNFANIKFDSKALEALDDLPWLRMTAFAAAGGTVTTQGVTVGNVKPAASPSSGDKLVSSNAQASDAKLAASRSSSSSTTQTTAVVNNNKKTTTILPKPPVRNPDPSGSTYRGMGSLRGHEF